MRDEYELKLAVSRKHLSALEHHELIRSAMREEKKRSRLVTTYFDTPENGLRKRGMALRVRHSGQRRVQTLKAAAEGVGSAHHHREYEAEIEGDRPDISLIQPPRMRKLLSCNKLDRSLTPIFTTDIERESIPLRFADSHIELALDVGRIRSDGHEREVCEAELELTSGPRAGIIELALALCDSVPFRLESRTKAALGYVMSKREVPQAVRAAPVALTAKMGVGEAFEVVAQAAIAQLRANEAAFVETADAEAVHQMRVAVRRLRAALGLFAKALDRDARSGLAAELRWLQRRLGAARDWDVFVSETLDPAISKLDADAGIAGLREAARSLHNDAYRRVRRTLDGRRYTRMLLSVELWLNDHAWLLAPGPGGDRREARRIRSYTQRRLGRWDAKLCADLARHEALSAAERHAVRIRAKKLRYASEFVAGMFPGGGARDYIAGLKSLQDAFGTANDLVIAERLLGALAGRMARNGDAPAKVAGAVDPIRGWLASQRDDCADRQGRAVRRCLESARFWS